MVYILSHLSGGYLALTLVGHIYQEPPLVYVYICVLYHRCMYTCKYICVCLTVGSSQQSSFLHRHSSQSPVR